MSGMGERLIGMGKYRKSRAFSPEGFFECEGRGLKWLGEAQSQGGPRVVDVYDWGKDYLDIERVNACGPTIQAARDFGVALAHMHDAGAEHFGSAPTGYDGTCYFGPLQDPSRWIPVPGMMCHLSGGRQIASDGTTRHETSRTDRL